jgi:hypothetical protein
MAVTEFRIGPPVAKWRITMLTERVSVLSQGNVRFSVTADSQGLPVNPTGQAGMVAFLTSDVDPVAGDWKAATWDVTQILGYCLEVNPGPTGAALAAGTYYTWVQIIDPQTGKPVIAPVGELIVQ